MNEQTLANRPESLNPRHLIQGYQDLEALALDLRWSWSHFGDQLWQKLDPNLWDLTRNPWTVLQTVSKEKLEKFLSDPSFRKVINDMLEIYRTKSEGPAWFQEKYPQIPLKHVAYFSMEYMLSEALPIYSGGLGNVAGDQLKAASDLGVPVSAVGLLYQQGYFRQIIDKEGAQQAYYPYNDPSQLPITPLRKANGEWLRLEISLPGYSIWIRTWQVKVGRTHLYLLDSNDAANFPSYRSITSELYGGDSELRLKQELILGIGGYRLLDAIGIKPDVCHLNECHAAFVVIERAKKFMEETGQPFEKALAATKVGNLFTTHTAVPAGFDRFSPQMLEQYLGRYVGNQLHIPFKDFLSLGRQNPNDVNEPFNMAYLAMRGSNIINGVSELHAKVSRKIFSPLFPQYTEDQVPIGFVTNGIHVPSWDSPQADKLWTDSCGKLRWLGAIDDLEEKIKKVPDEQIWNLRNEERSSLVQFVRTRAARQLAVNSAPVEAIEKARNMFDPGILTLGFARRFATYKRPNMLLHDPDRLVSMLTNSKQPVQLILAGKAHPADIPGQNLIKEWTKFIRRNDVQGRIIFLADYDMMITEQLVHGVDVWINTPRRPWEACGTSGMKVLSNGGLNLSILDGWWAEAYRPEVGWAIGDGKEHGDDPAWDATEANALYEKLEREIIPMFYNKDQRGIPVEWVAHIRESLASLTPQFSANRSVREYTEKYYVPAAKSYHIQEEELHIAVK